MNEQIKNLAKKANLINRKFMFGQYYEDDLTDEQKTFAELIIRECAKQCNPEPGFKYSPNSLSARIDCKNKILGMLNE